MKSLKSNINNLKAVIPATFQIVNISLFIICFIATGCSLIKLKKDTNRFQEYTAIVGHINAKCLGNGPIIVAACSVEDEMKVVNYTVLHDSGEYELGVHQGNYYIFAYRDQNSNLIYDADEPAGQYGNPTLVRAPAVGVVFDIDIIIPEKNQNIEIPHGKIISSVKTQKLYSRQAGIITDLDDERFVEENGKKGFWEPGSFFNQFGGTIYFLEEYDPDKIPILFIHGATGTPKGWQYLVNHIDRSRFQPWFFYYPTGLRIDSIAYLLLWKLSNLQAKYQFNKIIFTAHSMGGLVARSFIVNYFPQFPYVTLFVSMATPWGGDRMAEYGVKQSPVVIPSWYDMQPDGDFIKSLYRKKLPESVTFYLLYGYRGSRNPLRSNNDGTITLSSLLDYRPQAEAGMSYAFNEDHVSLLLSERVADQFNFILNTFYENNSTSLEQVGGYLDVHFTYDYDYKGVRPKPALLLYRNGKKDEEAVTFFNNGTNGKIIGPIPVGEYVTSMVTMAAKTEKKSVTVSIESNKTKELNFVFKPDGVIRGCLTTALKPEDKFAGRPDYRYRSIDTKIHIQSITLEGDGIHKVLTSTTVPAIGYGLGSLVVRKDGCFNNCFSFFGLPAGDYKFVIKVEGYKPIEKKYSVIPGRPQYFRVTELPPG
ncbi:alpha/beta hydrolase [uncultured Desulfobacter sp.]|uniref:lipase family alpha/beta hydrolase n=1 Tax=uncultured Desulfobacter sp. TaxID=240139 RepID=UPI002AA6D7E8|nr:alpha/beta hydrolase [uncultured Desulfobacter sp.]